MFCVKCPDGIRVHLWQRSGRPYLPPGLLLLAGSQVRVSTRIEGNEDWSHPGI